ncbi:MAG TPA: hypothetical protein VHL11_23665, partial [Phototrophicaceae bacterium]|nr:hypothetical protein [Phototrophicaceae bacterium]
EVWANRGDFNCSTVFNVDDLRQVVTDASGVKPSLTPVIPPPLTVVPTGTHAPTVLAPTPFPTPTVNTSGN